MAKDKTFLCIFFSCFLFCFYLSILFCHTTMRGQVYRPLYNMHISLDGDVALYVCVCVWTGTLFFSVFVLVICFPVAIILDIKSL